MTQDRFAWLEPATQLDHELTLAVGEGYCTEQTDTAAYATVQELRQGLKPGHLVSAAALAYLRQGTERRWVLLRRDEHADIDAGKWQFPAGRTTCDELPLTTACRQLSREVALIADGESLAWRNARIRVGGGLVSYLRQDQVDYFKGRYVYAHNTLEFYYPMELEVADLDAVTLADNGAHERVAATYSFDEVESMARKGLLTDAAAALWAAAKAEGVLILS